MQLSVKQYGVFFALLITLLVSVFAYQINIKLDTTRQQIEMSQESVAKNELQHAIALTMENITQSVDNLTQWQEVKQQLDNPDIFAYWYSVRFKKYAFDLQRYTQELMIYDINGKALDQLEDNELPASIDIKAATDFCFRIINDRDIITISPIYKEGNNKLIIGYLSARIQLLPLLKSLSPFQYIELGTIQLHADNPDLFIEQLQTENFSYSLHKAEGILVLEAQMRDSIIELILIIVIPTLIVFAIFIIIVGKPIKDINEYINRLRIQPELINKKIHHGTFQIKELASVYDSLVKYHTELSQKEEHISLTLNSIGDAVITTDAENRIVRMNPVAEQLTDWSFSEAEGKPVKQVFKLIDAVSRKSIEDPFQSVIETGKIAHLSKDTILISKDKYEYHIADSAAPIRDSKGKIRGIVLVFNDITEKIKKDEQLQQSMKMDALGKLTGGIAHDFNNLLGVILGYSELLKSLLKGEEKTLHYAEQIHNAGERARKLTAKLLTFSRNAPPEAAVTDVNQIILSEQHMLEKTLTARIELKLELEDDLCPVHLDAAQLRDAILNICINAMHAMPDGGVLTITSRKVYIEGFEKYHVDLDTGDYLQLIIADTGIGMDRNTSRKIFDPFFTTKGDKGTGLGMSQVYGFVHQSGGDISIDSEPGYGTRVIIYLPCYQDADNVLENQQEYHLQNDKVTMGNETVLVVDDEPALLEFSCQVLDSHGYRTLKASGSEEALAILENEEVDLLLTDVIMPKIDGYQLAKIVSKKYPQIKIQMVTGFSDDRNKAVENSQLHRQQLDKPFNAVELLTKVREALDG